MPHQRLNSARDVAITGGVIAAIEPDIPESASDTDHFC